MIGMAQPNGRVPADSVPSFEEGSSHTVQAEVPQSSLVSIEHPLIVRNLDRGLKSLGGEQQIKHVFEDEVKIGTTKKAQRKKTGDLRPVVGVSLRPDDILAKKLPSTVVDTRNILVKVTVPKWTGRKRKRGTDEPFSYSGIADSPDLRRRLQDNINFYKIEPVGTINTTHRFLGKPDLQVQSAEAPGMREIKDHASTPNYENLQKFHIDLTPGSAGIQALPRPPDFLPSAMLCAGGWRILQPDDPFGHEDQDSPAVYAKTAKAIPEHFVDNEDDEDYVLQSPQSKTQPKGKPGPKPKPKRDRAGEMPNFVKEGYAAYLQLLEQRPAMTQHAAEGLVPNIPKYKLIHARTWYPVPPTASGPWDGCTIKAGIDPTSDQKYRFFQTIDCRKANATRDELASRPDGANAHIFDGSSIPGKGQKWQLCDLTDPVLQSLVRTDNVRRTCDREACGWYHSGTLAKIKVIARDKMRRLLTSQPLLPGTQYQAIAAMPDFMDQSIDLQPFVTGLGSGALQLALEVRTDALANFRPEPEIATEDHDVRSDEKVAEEETQTLPTTSSWGVGSAYARPPLHGGFTAVLNSQQSGYAR